jgi:hypothetical protein
VFDELFGGYSHYFSADSLWVRIDKIPHILRKFLPAGIKALSPSSWNRIISTMNMCTPSSHKINITGDKLYKGISLLHCKSGKGFYEQLLNHWSPESVVLGLNQSDIITSNQWPILPSLPEQMMAMDSSNYLSDDILVKVDRAAMAVSLETRLPLLDYRIFVFDGNCHGDHIIRTLPHVDVIIRVYWLISKGRCQCGNNLVSIHVRAGAGAGLEYIDRKLRKVLTINDGLAGLFNRIRFYLAQMS